MDPNLEHLERYQVIEEVGRGGMAVVYRGQDRTLEREVAIKVLHPHLASTPEARARFRQEARAVAKLRHRNIIEIFDYDDGSSEGGISYIVTEFIEGLTLKAFLEQSKCFFPEIASLVAVEICDAISHAHDAGVIHRDLKPENIMITKDGRLKLMDFGIAKVVDQHEQMTVTGSILGSPAHMAPEMLEGKKLDARSDLFSLGTILYWMSTGRLPFTGTNPHQVLRGIIEGQFPDPQMVNPELGADLCRIIKRTLANNPEDRYASADELRHALLSQLEFLDLGSAQQELEKFFSDPEAYEKNLRPRVEVRLLARAKRAIAGKDYRPALEDLDRLLAMVPNHTEAISLVNGLERKKRLLKMGLISAGVIAALCAIVIVSWAMWAVYLRMSENPASNGKATDSFGTSFIDGTDKGDHVDAGIVATQQGEVAQDGERSSESDTALSSAKGDESAHELLKHPSDSNRTRMSISSARKSGKRLSMLQHADKLKVDSVPVQIVVQPYFQSVSIDGKQVAVLDEKNNGLVANAHLGPGPHLVVVKNDTCQTLEFTALVPKDIAPHEVVKFRKRLKFKPATLVVDCSYPNALVFVDGKFKGTVSETKANPIVIPIEGRNPRPEVRLRLRHPKAGEVRTKLRVTAGRLTTRSVERSEFEHGMPTVDGGIR